MVNRILALLKPGDNEDPPYGDFVVVSGPFGSLSVTRNVRARSSACSIAGGVRGG